jgi:Spy/CpxP family protein refolding chaperone
MRKSILFVLCGFFVGLVSGPVFSGAYMGHGGGRWQGGGLGLLSPWMLQKLNLSSDPQIQQIHATHKNNMQTLFTDPTLKNLRTEAMTKFYASGSLTAADFSSYLQSVNNLQNSIAKDRLNEALEIRDKLTPEQLATVAQLVEHMHQIHAQMQDLATEH